VIHKTDKSTPLASYAFLEFTKKSLYLVKKDLV